MSANRRQRLVGLGSGAVAALAALAIALAAVPSPAAAAEGTSPSLDAVVDHVTQALGGKKAWDDTHYVKFSFAGRRTHWWDKWTGRHRVEGSTREGQKYIVLENLNTREGKAWVDGQEVAADKAKEWLDRGYGAWINDTYWLLMPYKLRDPGVNLVAAGEETIDGKTYDKLALTFGKVGLTPGDRYWAWIDRGTGLMDRWAYVLQDQPADAAPTVWKWEGWQRYGNVMLAPHRTQVGGEGKIELSDIAVPAELPDSVFTSSAPVQ
jgi:hypothetical protein